MSAREDLMRLFKEYGQTQYPAQLADTVLDKHAHELAEKIRQHDGGCGDPNEYWGCDMETCHYFANLIDPGKADE